MIRTPAVSFQGGSDPFEFAVRVYTGVTIYQNTAVLFNLKQEYNSKNSM